MRSSMIGDRALRAFAGPFPGRGTLVSLPPDQAYPRMVSDSARIGRALDAWGTV
jgi:hypothetical protein